ncbi:hypothetical protein V8E52_011458 [Russula decolorans]
MSAGNMNKLFNIWEASLVPFDAPPPFTNADDMYEIIDSTPYGDLRWQSFTIRYNLHNDPPSTKAPAAWKTAEYDGWFRDPCKLIRNMLANRGFDKEFDYVPYQEYDYKGQHRFHDVFSGNWCWRQADIIAEDPNTHGAMIVPIILGSDKTTVSVATGNNEYWSAYLSIGNIHNKVRRAHRNGLVLLGFLPIPKSHKRYADDGKFRRFRRQIFHIALARILTLLKESMTTLEVNMCPDGQYRRAIYSFGPYIGDYPEQVLLASVVQFWCLKCLTPKDNLDRPDQSYRCREHTNVLIESWSTLKLWDEYGVVDNVKSFTTHFPRADIYEMITPDLLHQVIKGAFKDHIVTWVQQWLIQAHGDAWAKKIIEDIDYRIAIIAPFSGLRRFPQGRGFKQWTGDDSKALMKVYLPTIEGHVPTKMVRAVRDLIEFSYLVRRDVHDTQTVEAINTALKSFHINREIFRTSGVIDHFNYPHQHSLKHYVAMIRAYSSPNGLCSSMTENKHIKAVKQPWRWSNRYNAMKQMLLTNQRLDKLSASRTHFTSNGMLEGTCLSKALVERPEPDDDTEDIDADAILELNRAARVAKEDKDDEDNYDVNGPRVIADVILAKTLVAQETPATIATRIQCPDFPFLIRCFLYGQLAGHEDPTDNIPQSSLPIINPATKFSVYHSAIATFFAPSDLSGIGGMRSERIRALPSWRNGPSRYDTVLVSTDRQLEGMIGLDVARVRLFFSFTHEDIEYPCALINWYDRVSNSQDEDTGMWIVKPVPGSSAVIHIDAILRCAHLIPVFGQNFIDRSINLTYNNSLDAFLCYYVNKYADHHMHEIVY